MLRELGRGGFGVVFAARRAVDDGGVVAIKIPHPDTPHAAERLRWEAEALAVVGPPSAPGLRESGVLDDGRPFLVVDLLPPPSLADHLAARAGALPLAEALELGRAVATVVAGVHRRGFVHCDVKPENLFLRGAPGTWGARLIDFGLAVRPGAPEQPWAGGPAGTAETMAPEQCEGRRDLDARADVYAVGIVLYEMLTGRPPFWGGSADVQRRHRVERPAPMVPAPPAAVEEVVRRCLAKGREQRYRDGDELVAALVAAASAGEVERSEPAPRPAAAPPPAPAPTQARERRTVAVLLFSSEADVRALQEVLASFGGLLAHAEAARCAGVFDRDAGDHPIRRAIDAADALVGRGLCPRVLSDLAPVRIQIRSDGSRRYQSMTFSAAEKFPTSADPQGVLATRAVIEASPELRGPDVAGRPGWVQVDSGRGRPRDATVYGTAAAPLFGREAVLRQLCGAARRSAEERLPTVARVLAAPGHGKSRLGRALSLRLRAELPDARILELRAREPAERDADQVLRDLVRAALDLPATLDANAGRLQLEEALGAPAALGVAIALGWVDPDDPDYASARAAPGAVRAIVGLGAAQTVRRMARSGPVVVLLDDAQHADDSALDALELAALDEARAPVFVCALGRPEFGAARPTWGERAARRELLELGPLDREAAHALCRSLLAPAVDVPEPAVEHIVARAERIPLLLVELARGLKRDGVIRRHPRGDSYYVATDELDRLPDLPLVQWLATRELEAFPPALAAHARLVALLGVELSTAEIEGTLRGLERAGHGAAFPLDAGAGVQRLLAGGLLVMHREGRVGFRHALVRDAIAAAVPPDLRQAVHHAAHAFYEQARDLPDGLRLAQLAAHAARAGLREPARDAYRTLALRAAARHAFLEAEAHWTRVVDLLAGGDGAIDLEASRGRGLMRYRLGRYDDAILDLEGARAMAHRLGDRGVEAEILLDHATALDWMDEYRQSRALVEEAATCAGAKASPLLSARLLLGRGRSLHRFSQEAEASELLLRAAEAADRLGDEGYETLVIALLMLGFILPNLGRAVEAGEVLARAIDESTRRGDRVHLYGALNNRALLRGLLGDKRAMVEDLERVLELGRELGQATMELTGQYNLGEFLFLMGDLDAAEPHVRRAIEIERRRLGDDARPVVALLDARLRLRRGDLGGARSIVDPILARRARASGAEEALLVPSEDVLCSMVDLATRGGSEAEWAALEERSARFSVGQERLEVLETHALVAQREGRLADALRALGAAVELASSVPSVMADRLRRELEALGGSSGGGDDRSLTGMASSGAP